ncbi:hypothetical protein [Bacillus sp. ISL-46]|uniref:hypothetical protein n=1 Tax=Bacillus sp. ISL-46 TaxID=2819129 RepID=UPI001BE9080E|nr:hypothetical protein [Bacillus sp. ISL-46]MBT2724990.1 hypothetical protein [Bacillus sp. ISL-46]
MKVGNARFMISDEFSGHNHATKSLGGTPVIIYLYVNYVDDVVERAVRSGSTSLKSIQDLLMETVWEKLKTHSGMYGWLLHR